MRRGDLALAACALVAGTSAAVSLAQAPPTPAPPVPMERLVAEGQAVFETTCSNQYCHGPGGRGAMGPALAGVPMAPNVVRATIREGRAGTQMAAFKGILEPRQLDAVNAYVLLLSTGQMPQPAALAGGADRPPGPPAPSPIPVAIGKDRGTPTAGFESFFDASRMTSCRTCHSYNGRGGPLGLDFALARKSPQQILAVLRQAPRAARGYPVISVQTSSGVKLTGVRGTENEETLSVYDISVPPVKRTFRKADIADIKVAKVGVFDHRKLGYTRQQRLDLAALLGTSGQSPTGVD